MDDLDRKIIALLASNARITVKAIAQRVSLTSPAVSERIRRLERSGVIEGYTVRLSPEVGKGAIGAVISVYIKPGDRQAFYELLCEQEGVEECYQVTGSLSHMLKVRCADIEALDTLINRMQKLGQTNTQIILSTLKTLEGWVPPES